MHPLDAELHTLTDLHAAWNFIDGGHGYSASQLFALLIDAHDIALPTVIQMYDEGPPDDELIGLLMLRLEEAITEFTPDGSVAMMKARPGSATFSELDHTWCRLLHRHLREAPFASRPLFYATDIGVRIVPPDVLIGEQRS